MKLKSIEISGLYKQLSISTKLDSQLNIFVGNNGSYKTTMLRLLHDAISSNGVNVDYPFNSFQLDFDDNTTLSYKRMNRNYSNNGVIDNSIEVLYASALRDNKSVDIKTILNEINFDSVFTYDVKSDGVAIDKSYFTSTLENKVSAYGMYLADIFDKVNDMLNNGNNDAAKSAFDGRNTFKDIINEAFEDTGKYIDNINKMTFSIKSNSQNTEISYTSLSSGEKQLIIILLTVLLQREKPYIFILDEPEISMHIIWQSHLIDWIFRLNPNVQLILSTHSPSIFGKGWGEKVIYMEDIVKDI